MNSRRWNDEHECSGDEKRMEQQALELIGARIVSDHGALRFQYKYFKLTSVLYRLRFPSVRSPTSMSLQTDSENRRKERSSRSGGGAPGP